MASHTSTLAWKIPWTEKPARLPSMGLQRVRHDWLTSLSLFIFMHWRRKWQPTPVFLPGESQGWGACWAAVCGVTQSQTRLKQLSSRLIITFFLRSKCLNFMAAVTICSDFGAQKIKSVTVSTVSPYICHEVMGMDAKILVFWMLSFKPTFSLSSFTFIKRLFHSSSLSAITVVSSAYLRLLVFLPAILIPACASSSPFLMMYSTYKLNKQGDNIQPWCTPFLIWDQCVVPCPVLTVASWPAYRFLKR